MSRPTRRQFLHAVAPFAVAAVALSRAARATATCIEPDSESLRASLNYVSTAADPAAACAHCAFFTGDSAGGACGACQILGGPVDATGHCDSFSTPS